MRFFYVTYEWQEGEKFGHGEVLVSRDDFSIKDFRKIACEAAQKPNEQIRIHVTEITESDYLKNIDDLFATSKKSNNG